MRNLEYNIEGGCLVNERFAKSNFIANFAMEYIFFYNEDIHRKAIETIRRPTS